MRLLCAVIHVQLKAFADGNVVHCDADALHLVGLYRPVDPMLKIFKSHREILDLGKHTQ